MTHTYVKGNLLNMDDQFDVIVHGCNCFCTMGAGFAKAIADKYPQVRQADQNTGYGNPNKLGNWSMAVIDRLDNTTLYILNAYTQYGFSNGGNVFEYSAFDLILRKMELTDTIKNLKIGMPKIGAGLARGNWQLIEQIINRHSLNITVVEYHGN